jgi:hypothetical protein
LKKGQRDHIAADAAHGDAIANRKRLAAQDHQVPGKGGDHLLQCEGEAGADEADDRGEAAAVLEP